MKNKNKPKNRPKRKKPGWYNESMRHSLSSHGIKTSPSGKYEYPNTPLKSPFDRKKLRGQDMHTAYLAKDIYLSEYGDPSKEPLTQGQLEYLEMLGVPTDDAKRFSKTGASYAIAQLKEDKLNMLRDEIEENERRLRTGEINRNEFLENAALLHHEYSSLSQKVKK